MSDADHWNAIYRHRPAAEVTWFRPHLDRSLALLAACPIPPSAHVVDVGAGASTLVDDLLERGFTNLTVVDLSEVALARSRARLGDRGRAIRWIAGDVTRPLLAPGSVDVWHDRAAFHFLTDRRDRARYVDHLHRALRPGGHALIATFAPDGPARCSGLPVARYAPDEIAAVLGDAFEKIAEAREVHETPRGTTQAFAYALCRRRGGGAPA